MGVRRAMYGYRRPYTKKDREDAWAIIAFLTILVLGFIAMCAYHL